MRWRCWGHSGPNYVRYLSHSARAGSEESTWLMQYLTNSLKQLCGRHPVISRTGLVLGIGIASGLSFSLYKFINSDRYCSDSCFSDDQTLRYTTTRIIPEASNAELSKTAKLSVTEFKLTQRLLLLARLVYLCFLFSPALLLYGMGHIFGSPSLTGYGWRYTLSVLERAGPTFIKLGQWASMRRDLFPEGLCQTLTQLHFCCHSHSWPETVKQLENSLGPDWQDHLVISDHTPIGSGSVAQVYEGQLHVRGVEDIADGGGGEERVGGEDVVPSRVTRIAVKVLHPNIVVRVQRDICLMKYVTSWIDFMYPDIYWVALTECVDEFSSMMEKQVRRELEHRGLMSFTFVCCSLLASPILVCLTLSHLFPFLLSLSVVPSWTWFLRLVTW